MDAWLITKNLTECVHSLERSLNTSFLDSYPIFCEKSDCIPQPRFWPLHFEVTDEGVNIVIRYIREALVYPMELEVVTKGMAMDTKDVR